MISLGDLRCSEYLGSLNSYLGNKYLLKKGLFSLWQYIRASSRLHSLEDRIVEMELGTCTDQYSSATPLLQSQIVSQS